jgi:ribose 5-phosphate isomerase B
MVFEEVLIASDHAGFDLKQVIKDFLKEKNIKVEDLGTYTKESCDYPVFARKLCKELLKREKEGRKVCGILLCGTGIGMSIQANRFKGIRATLCSTEYTAKMSRRHNNANVLCLGGRVLGPELAKAIVEDFLNEEFEGGRHQRRVDYFDKDLEL